MKQISGKGIVEVSQDELAAKYGRDNVNLITKFEIQATQDALVIEILGKNRMMENEAVRAQPISEKEHNVMRKFLIFPSKEVQRVTINSENKNQISRKFYLLSGKACYYLDKDKNAKNTHPCDNLILAAYQEGYFNPSFFKADSQI